MTETEKQPHRPDYTEIIERGQRRMVLKDLELIDKYARAIQARNIVEIGSMDGTSSILLGLIARDFAGRLFCIEPQPKSRWAKNMIECDLKEHVELIKACSPWVEMDKIQTPIDFLLIDGNHRTRWAIVDYHYFFPFVREGGLIAFHDYNARKEVGKWVRRAIDIILEDDAEKIKEVGHNETSDRGTIIFRKECP